MASIPSAVETSFDPEVSLLRTQRSGSSALGPRSGEPSEGAPKAPRAEAPAEAHIQAPPNRAVTFRLDRESDRFYIQVVDRSTGEVVRQIPPESLLELAKSVGNLLNVSA